MIAKGLRWFIRETVVPRPYNMADDPFRKNLLTYLFAAEALDAELDNLTPEGLGYMEQRKSVPITVDTAMFSVYVFLTKCMAKVYGDSANMVYLNDVILARGMVTLFEDLAHGDLPTLSMLPPAEAMLMRRLRESIGESMAKERETAMAEVAGEPEKVN